MRNNNAKSNVGQIFGKLFKYLLYFLGILTVWLALNGRINQRQVFNYCANAWEYVTHYLGNTLFKLVNPKGGGQGLDITDNGIYLPGKEKNLHKSTEEHVKDANKEAEDSKSKNQDNNDKDKNKENKK